MVREMIQRGDLPAVIDGTNYRIDPGDIDAILESRRVQPGSLKYRWSGRREDRAAGPIVSKRSTADHGH